MPHNSRERSTALLLLGANVSGFLAAVALVLPWFRLGGRTRSSIDLIGSLGALDVIEGGVKVAVVAAWFMVPVLVCGAMLSGAAGRFRLSSALLAPLGPLLVGAVVLVLVVAGDVLAWGAYSTATLALLATASAVLVIRRTP